MAQNLSGYHRALDLFEGLVAGVSRDGWDAPSPCAGWTARDVAGHVTGGQYLVRALATGEPMPDVGRDPARFVPGDVLMSWRTARKESAAALTPDALERPIPFGGLGDLPLRDYLEAYILEPLVRPPTAGSTCSAAPIRSRCQSTAASIANRSTPSAATAVTVSIG